VHGAVGNMGATALTWRSDSSAIEATRSHTLVMSFSGRYPNGRRAPAVHIGASFDSMNAGAFTAFSSDLVRGGKDIRSGQVMN
jgi:hypothetical protein